MPKASKVSVNVTVTPTKISKAKSSKTYPPPPPPAPPAPDSIGIQTGPKGPAIAEPKKRGRKPLTPEQRYISEQNKKKYYQEYYKTHKDKYVSTSKLNYGQSKIYALTSKSTDKVYVGGTALPLEARYYTHLYMMNTRPSATYKKMLELAKDWQISLLTSCPLKTRKELEELETIWITAMGPKCLNINKKFSMEAIKDLLDGRFPETALPTGVKNIVSPQKTV